MNYNKQERPKRTQFSSSAVKRFWVLFILMISLAVCVNTIEIKLYETIKTVSISIWILWSLYEDWKLNDQIRRERNRERQQRETRERL